MTLPLEEQIACIKRELALRTRVYPGLVTTGRQTQAWADYQVAAMQAVLETLEGLQPRDQAALFATKEDP